MRCHNITGRCLYLDAERFAVDTSHCYTTFNAGCGGLVQGKLVPAGREAERLEGRLSLPIEVTFLPKYTWRIYPITSASYNLNLTSNALYTCLLGTRQTIYVACLLYEEHFMMQYGALLRRCVHSLL